MPELSLDGLKSKATTIRELIIRITTEAGSGHPTSSLSATEVVTALYFGGFMSYDPKKPNDPNRDRFILSKGHACPVLYSAMAEAGYFTTDDIMTLRKLGSPWEGHPNMRRLPGIEASTGSLGQGLSIGIGHALAGKMDGKDYHTYVMMGDGEMGEGQVWEAIAAAEKYKLGNLTAIIDQNGYQQTGATKEVLDLTKFQPKFEAFGWHVQTINGNDMETVVAALKTAKGVTDQPTCIVSQTQKGYPVVPLLEAEGDPNYHGKPFSPELAEKAIAMIG
ncbi:MAG: transketolase [Planctomycetaceae bacterium]|nr:transketolase [Planctomycetaceae bacterium]